jgi:hypothetical protein
MKKESAPLEVGRLYDLAEIQDLLVTYNHRIFP